MKGALTTISERLVQRTRTTLYQSVHRLTIFCACICRAQEKFQQQTMKYFTMLTEGCGNEDCANLDCASYKKAHGESIPIPNKAAVLAVRFVREKKKLCTEKKSIPEETVNGRRSWVNRLSPRQPLESGAAVDEDHDEAMSTASMEVNTPRVVLQQDGRHLGHVAEGMEMSSGPQVHEMDPVQDTASGRSEMVGTIAMDSSLKSKPSKVIVTGEWMVGCIHMCKECCVNGCGCQLPLC